jgi:hypothetical protein
VRGEEVMRLVARPLPNPDHPRDEGGVDGKGDKENQGGRIKDEG